MEEKKIVYKSIDEQLADDERTAATGQKSYDKGVEHIQSGQTRGRKKLRLKKSARRTIGSLMLATSIVVGAIPVDGVRAVTDEYDGGYNEANYISSSEVSLPSADQVLQDKDASGSSFAYSGHINGSTTTVVAGNDGRLGFPLRLEKDAISGQMKPASETLNGEQYYYVDSSVYLAGGTIEPLFKLDDSNKKIKECLQPADFTSTRLSLDCYYGYNNNDAPAEPVIFVEDGVSYKWIVTKQNTTGNCYKAQKFRWQENISTLMTRSLSPSVFNEDIAGEEQADSRNDDSSIESSDNRSETTEVIDVENQEIENHSEQSDQSNNNSTSIDNSNVTDNNQEFDSSSNQAEDDSESIITTEDVNMEGSGAIGFSLSGTVVVATVDDPATGRWVEDGDPVVLCKYTDTYNVVCNDAFINIPSSIRTIDIPDYSTLEKIGDRAFKGTGITEINLSGPNLQMIGVNSFAGCATLSNVNLGDALSNIGDGAFAGDTMISSIKIPYTANVGCAAFYGDSLSNIDVSECTGINVGDYAFACNTSLNTVDLDYANQGANTNTIANLANIKGLFAGCTALSGIALPRGFEGKLQSGVFQNCTGISTVILRNSKSDFSGGEFDRTKVKVYGPDPEVLNPESTRGSVGVVNGYNTCLEWIDEEDHDYSYDYLYYGCNMPIGYISTNMLPSPQYVHKYCNNYIPNGDNYVYPKTVMQVDTSEYISGKFERTGGPNPYTLIIDGGVGVYPNQFNVSGINSEVFMNDSNLDGVRIGDRYENNYSLSFLGEKAFYNCINIKDIFINVNGTTISKECFANNKAVASIEFGRAGSAESNIGERAFYNCGAATYELPVSFVNDDLRYGNENDYAVINSIGTDAFSHDNRTVSIVFKGPFYENPTDPYSTTQYVPFAYAINPSSKVGQGNYFIKYRSGNPRNLECIYKLGWESGGEKYPDGVYLLSYPNMTSHLGKDDKYDVVYGYEVSPRDIVDIQNGYNSGDSNFPDNSTDIENNCLKYTKEITIPDGIDYIDIAESEILDKVCTEIEDDYYDLHPMYKKESSEPHGYNVYDDNHGRYDGTAPTNASSNYVYKQFRYVKDLEKVTFNGQQYFPDKMFEGSTDLIEVNFNKDVIDLGVLPFYLPDTEGDNNESHIKRSPSSVSVVNFNAEIEDYTVNPVYRGTESGLVGMIKSDKDLAGSKTVYLEQVFPGRGYIVGSETISGDEIADVSYINEYAARDCDKINEVQLDKVTKSLVLEKGCFYDCDNLQEVFFPDKITEVHEDSFAHINNNHLNIYVPSIKTTFRDNAFSPTVDGSDTNPKAYILGPDDDDVVEKFTEYASNFANVNFAVDESQIKPKVRFIISDTGEVIYTATLNYKDTVEDIVTYIVDKDKKYTWVGTDKNGNKKTITSQLTCDTDFYTQKAWKVTFTMPDGTTEINTVNVVDNGKVSAEDIPTSEDMPELYNGKAFSNKWLPSPTLTTITKDTIIRAVYDKDPGSSSSSSSSTSTSSSAATTASGGGTSSRSSASSSSRSSSSSSSSSSSAAPVYVNSQEVGAATPVTAAGVNSTVYVGDSSGSGSTGSGGSSRGSGNTNVISTAGGISDTGKISATVNGSSDNYVIKISQTQEADEAALNALHNEYGDDISAIRYLPFDISLYDSTGSNKISPIPDGVSVSMTMPIPDDLAIYGGNAKIASTAGGVLDKMTPRFTVINGVPCMTYTCTHFSPYMVWVDTANLTEAGIMDATPKTADGIHPKWFLCIGLAAISVVLFIKKDPEEYLKKKAA